MEKARRGLLYAPGSIPRQKAKISGKPSPKYPAVPGHMPFPFGFACNRRRGCRSRFYKRVNDPDTFTNKRGLLCNRRRGCSSFRRHGKSMLLDAIGPEPASANDAEMQEKQEKMCSLWRCNDAEDVNIRKRIVCKSLGCRIKSMNKLNRRKRDGSHDERLIMFGCNTRFCYGTDFIDKGKHRRDSQSGLVEGVYIIDLIYQKKHNCDVRNCYTWAGFHARQPEKTEGKCDKNIKCGSYKDRIPAYPQSETKSVTLDAGQMVLKWSCTNNNKCTGEIRKPPEIPRSTVVQVTKYKGYSFILPDYSSLFRLVLECKCKSSATCECCGTKTYTDSESRRDLSADGDSDENHYRRMATEEDAEDNYLSLDKDDDKQTPKNDRESSNEDEYLRDDLDEYDRQLDNVNMDFNVDDNYMQIRPAELENPDGNYLSMFNLPVRQQPKEGKWLDDNDKYGVALTRRQGCNFGQNCYWTQ